MVATASKAAHAHFAVWDGEGVGVTMATAGWDIAHMAARAIHNARTDHPSLMALFTTAEVLLGDWEVTFRIVQEKQGGDVLARIALTARTAD